MEREKQNRPQTPFATAVATLSPIGAVTMREKSGVQRLVLDVVVERCDDTLAIKTNIQRIWIGCMSS